MTSNQIRFAEHQENKRSNLMKESETARHNRAEEDVKWYGAYETKRSNLAKEKETNRANLAKETETHRANVINEAFKRNEDARAAERQPWEIDTLMEKLRLMEPEYRKSYYEADMAKERWKHRDWYEYWNEVNAAMRTIMPSLGGK